MYRGYRYITLLLETSRDIVDDVDALLLETSRDIMDDVDALLLETSRDIVDDVEALLLQTSQDIVDDVDALLLETSCDIVDDVEALLLETSRDVMAGGARDLETLRDDADETAPGGLLPRETSREGNDSVDLASRGLRSLVAPPWRLYPSHRRRWCGMFCNQRSS